MRVVIADDAVLLREGLARILTAEGFEVVATVGSGPDLVAAAGIHAPDLDLLKDRIVEVDDFLDGVRRVAAGGIAMDPAVVRQLLERPSRRPQPLAGLTEREREVLALMAEGLSNGGIGARLHIGVRTVETYTNAVFQKLGLHVAAEEHRRVRAVLAYLDATRS